MNKTEIIPYSVNFHTVENAAPSTLSVVHPEGSDLEVIPQYSFCSTKVSPDESSLPQNRLWARRTVRSTSFGQLGAAAVQPPTDRAHTLVAHYDNLFTLIWLLNLNY